MEHARRRQAAAAARRGGVHGRRLLGAGGPLAADRRHGARAAPLRRDGRRGGCGQQRAPRSRRRPAARPVGVARRLLGGTWPRHRHARPRVRHPRARRLPAPEPAARDRRGLGRPDRGRVGLRARRGLGADPRGAVVHAAPAEVAAHAPWAAAAVPAGHARGALRSALGRARAPLVRDERARVGSLGGGRDPRGPRRRRRALARRRGLRHRGAQPGRRDSVFSRVRRHVPVARRLSACAVRDRTRGGARVRDLHAGRLVRADDDRRRGDPRRPREGRLAVGPGLRLRLLAGGGRRCPTEVGHRGTRPTT